MHEKAPIIILRGAGILLLTALVPATMPFSWMQEIHQWLGMGELPTGPVVGYLTRTLSLLYALHGALVLYVSGDIFRYLPVIKCLAILGIAFGVVVICVDVAVGMPAYWVLCEGPLLIPLNIVLLWVASRVREP